MDQSSKELISKSGSGRLFAVNEATKRCRYLAKSPKKKKKEKWCPKEKKTTSGAAELRHIAQY